MQCRLLEHPIGPTTVADWLAMEHPPDGSRLELIDGYVHVTPPPSLQHQYAGDELRAVIKAALQDAHRTDLYAVTGGGRQDQHRLADRLDSRSCRSEGQAGRCGHRGS
jgi:hypothetical protein